MNQPAPEKKKSPLKLIIIVSVLVASCVPCIGITAAIGLPGFIGYVRSSKTAEAESNLRALYTGASSYYMMDHAVPGGTVSHCTVGPATSPNLPGPETQVVASMGPEFDDLGFMVLDPIYFQYEIIAGPSRCGVTRNQPLYTFRAHGDLDGDGMRSLFELTVSSNAMNEVGPPPEIYSVSELE